MLLSHNELLRFGGCTDSCRNFKEGKRLFDTKHILKCGRTDSAGKYNLLAFCVRGVDMKKPPSEKCKHIMCLLFYLEKNDLDKIELFSCAVVACYWKTPYKELLKN